MHLLRFAAVTAVLGATALAQSIVLPRGFAANVENSANAFPWASSVSTYTGLRIQHVYDSSHFTDEGVTYPIVVSGVRFRAQDVATTTSWVGGTYSNCSLLLSTAAVDYLATSTAYATNHGANLTVPLNAGQVAVLPGAGNGVGVPGPWFVDIQFGATPFTYDPNAGDLCCEIDQAAPVANWVPNGAGTGFTTLASVAGSATLDPKARRVYASTMYPNANGVDQNILVMEVQYAPTPGLHASFVADVQAGPSPLSVNFTDKSVTDDPSGIVAWAWDFNGDNVVDSNQQNPTFVYTTCGTYTVQLTVIDALHGSRTYTRTAYIQTDNLTANFTTQVIGPNTVQFTDTSSMVATSWAWDLDGDNVVDSTAQNPVWAYPSANAVNVTLTAARLCGTPSTITRSVTPTQQITTNLAANNGGASLWTVYYDINVLNPNGMSITSFDVITNTVSAAFTVDWYLKVGTYAGSEYNPAPWTHVAQASGTSNATANQPSLATFAQPLYLPQGSYGVALRYTGIVPRYVTLTAASTIANADVSLTLGSAAATTVAPFQGTTTTVNSPRMWSGTLYYNTYDVMAQAGYGFFAPGCAGSMGVSHLSFNLPQLGSTLNVTMNNLPLSACILLTGLSNTMSSFGPLPLDLAPFGAPGCPARVSADSTLFLFGAGNTATWSFPIPAMPYLSGLKLFNQALVLDPGFNGLNAVMSDAAGFIFGM